VVGLGVLTDRADHPGDDRQEDRGDRGEPDQPQGDPETTAYLRTDVGTGHRRAPLSLQQTDVAVGVAEAGQPQPVPLVERTIEIQPLSHRLDGLFRHRRGSRDQRSKWITCEVHEEEGEQRRGDQHGDRGQDTTHRVHEHARTFARTGGTMADLRGSGAPKRPGTASGYVLAISWQRAHPTPPCCRRSGDSTGGCRGCSRTRRRRTPGSACPTEAASTPPPAPSRPPRWPGPRSPR
jgi:hypothetical protein